MGHRVVALIIKELLALFRDKKSRMAVIVPPILQLLIFGYAATFDLEHAGLAIFNEDPGAVSQELIGRFASSAGFRVVGYLRSEAEIAPLPLPIDADRIARRAGFRAGQQPAAADAA